MAEHLLAKQEIAGPIPVFRSKGVWRNWQTRWSQEPVSREGREGSTPSLPTMETWHEWFKAPPC